MVVYLFIAERSTILPLRMCAGRINSPTRKQGTVNERYFLAYATGSVNIAQTRARVPTKTNMTLVLLPALTVGKVFAVLLLYPTVLFDYNRIIPLSCVNEQWSG